MNGPKWLVVTDSYQRATDALHREGIDPRSVHIVTTADGLRGWSDVDVYAMWFGIYGQRENDLRDEYNRRVSTSRLRPSRLRGVGSL